MTCILYIWGGCVAFGVAMYAWGLYIYPGRVTMSEDEAMGDTTGYDSTPPRGRK